MKKEKIKDGIVGMVFAIMSLILLLLVSSQISAQEIHETHNEEIINRSKNVSIGIRNGYFSGVSIQCEDERFVLENIILVNKKSFNQTLLYKKLINHSKINGLKAFVGIGCHYYHSNDTFDETLVGDNVIRKRPHCVGYDIFGLDFIMGMSYNIPKIPISVSLDIKPTAELFATNKSNSCFFYEDNAGITIRYTI